MRIPSLKLWLTVITAALSSTLSSPSIASSIDSSSAYVSDTRPEGSAVDSHGVRRRTRDYGRSIPPWLNDRVRAFAPDYPFADQVQRREGTGLFRLNLDLQTGSVTKVVLLRSTGFPTLDHCAISAIQEWRWRPGMWKEIEIPIKFSLHGGASRTEAARLPHRN
jgi:TonB family protein